MLHKWDSKLLLLSSMKHEGIKKVLGYYLYKKKNNKKNIVKRQLKEKLSYFKNDQFKLDGQVSFNKVPLSCLDKTMVLKFTDKIMEHKFNLLGSGWVGLNFDATKFPGYKGQVYETKARQLDIIENNNLTGNYRPIRWNVDFVSGYEWPSKAYFKDIKFGGDYGADIKKPWELGRFYHLAQLAFAYNLSTDPKYLDEITNQFYDFCHQCPVYIGPQWGNAMEVGIRAINWVFCIDQVGLDNFDSKFINKFEQFLKEHLDYILAELEWTTIARSNHYLANLSSIIVILSRINRSEELEHLYYWAASELNHEIEFQFKEDGGNYEGSTGYHRLSSELVLIALNILTSCEPQLTHKYNNFCKKNKFSLPQVHKGKFKISEHRDLVSKIVSFMGMLDIKPKQMIQVGDMDSGRVLKLTLLFDDDLAYENQLDVRPVLAMVDTNNNDYIESQAFKKSYKVNKVRFNKKIENINVNFFINNEDSMENKQEYSWESELNLTRSLSYSTFEKFGLYIAQSENLFLSIRCGGDGQNGVGGHSHNDQLSINLSINGDNLIEDPGSFIYTADPLLRNKYRSVHSHFAPTINQQEPSLLTRNLFRLKNNYNSQCLFFNGKEFLGFHDAYGVKVFRHIIIKKQSVTVTDYTDKDNFLDRLKLSNGRFNPQVPFSCGYGELSL